MRYTVQDFCSCMEKLAPLELALDWDNVGLQIGEPARPVSAALVTLTVTMETVEKAADEGADLIIAHHPVIFKPVRQIRTDTPEGGLLAALLKHELSVYVAHTNLDQAEYGVNHWLAREAGLDDDQVLVAANGSTAGLGRIGSIRPVSLGEYAGRLEALWGVPIRVVGDKQRTVARVAVVGGSGGDFVQHAKAAGADVLVTGDVSYHDAVDALSLGLSVLDAGHFSTEQLMIREVAAYLQKEFGEQVRILQDTSSSPFSF
ncbi:MAG: Nif3-like dinuclear metal center hexameric protein [Bacillota bacterium]|nr:Nif3-like dinuclear metal center hexameric protein [Bacillota bacterium]